MATKQNQKVMKFLDENPQIKGSCYGGRADVSRINDGWYEQGEYWFDSDVIMIYVNKLKALIPQELFEKNIPENERINW